MECPKAKSLDEFCYRGKCGVNNYTYGPTISDLGNDTKIINGKTCIDGSIVESTGYFFEDDTFIFPGDNVVKYVYSPSNYSFIYSLLNCHVEVIDNQALLIDNKTGKIREEMIHDKGVITVFAKEEKQLNMKELVENNPLFLQMYQRMNKK